MRTNPLIFNLLIFLFNLLLLLIRIIVRLFYLLFYSILITSIKKNSTFLQLHILEIHNIPQAVPFFVTPKAVDEDSVLLQQLPHWASCSITQALEFLTPPYKGHPRVMGYVLRVLESYPPESVTFFMPQLIQALRYDEEVKSYILVLRVFIYFLSSNPFLKSVNSIIV